MLKERRLIWREDQYRLLEWDPRKNIAYLGRVKGDTYLVYRKKSSIVRHQLLQKVAMDRDWSWCSKLKKLVDNDPVAAPVNTEKREDLLAGHFWISDGTTAHSRMDNVADSLREVIDGTDHDALAIRLEGLQDLRLDVTCGEYRLSTGARGLSFTPKDVRQWLISLHGGPDSFEGRDEIRYGGLYRELLRQKTGIVILNYRGSKTLPRAKGHGRSWRTSITADLEALFAETSLKSLAPENTTLFGASFGGALALLARENFDLKNTVVSSPLLDLMHQRHRAGSDFATWFEETFDPADFGEISPQNLTRSPRGAVTVLYGLQDEVLGTVPFRDLEILARGRTHLETHPSFQGHTPRSYRETCRQIDLIKNAIGMLN